jgi:hypothetical protein
MMPATTTVTKSLCERYDVRSRPEGCSYTDWAILTVSDHGGVLNILSDYGSWSYAWPRHGRESFKHFLCELGRDPHYLLNKLCGGQKWFDCKATVKNLRRIIGTMLRDKATVTVRGKHVPFTPAMARAAVGKIDEVAGEWSQSADLFVDRLVEDDETHFFWDYICDGLASYDFDPGARQFVARLWPAFVEALQKELAAPAQPEANPPVSAPA